MSKPFHHKFRQWCADGLFKNILKALTTDTEKYLLVEIDSTFCKVQLLKISNSSDYY